MRWSKSVKGISFTDSRRESLRTQDIDYFINSISLKFLERFNINTNFRQLEINKWSESSEYLKI